MFGYYLITSIAWALLMSAVVIELCRTADKGWSSRLTLTYGALLLVTIIFFACELRHQQVLMAALSAYVATATLSYLWIERVLLARWELRDEDLQAAEDCADCGQSHLQLVVDNTAA